MTAFVCMVLGAGALLFGIDSAAQLDRAALPNAQAAELARVKPRTLLEVHGPISGFAQDRDRIVWANTAEPCRRHILLRRLSTGKTISLVSRRGPACTSEVGYVDHRMALAGTRALWAYSTASLSAFHFTLFTAAAGDRRERELGSMDTVRDPQLPGGFRPIPMAGGGGTLAFADISDADERYADGVYRVTRSLKLLPESDGTVALAVSGGRIAVLRPVAPGCVCNGAAHWSPDGRAIFFQSTGGASGRSSAPYSMNADGTGLRRLTSLGAVFTALRSRRPAARSSTSALGRPGWAWPDPRSSSPRATVAAPAGWQRADRTRAGLPTAAPWLTTTTFPDPAASSSFRRRAARRG